jgi:SPW repeat
MNRTLRIQLAAGGVILWIALSPWLWGFASSRSAVANHVFMVFSFGPLAAMIVALRPAAIVTLIGGVWLVLSPWILGYASDHVAWLSELIAGGALATLSASAAGIPALLRRTEHERVRRSPSLESAA